MKVKDLIPLFSSATKYKIIYANNPHCIYWWGQGNKCNTCCNDDEIKGLHYKGKEIIIYI